MAKQKKKLSISAFMTVIILLLLAFTTASSAYFYKRMLSLKHNPQTAALQETDELLTEVGELIVLPTDETPTIATVTDPESLRSQEFFAQAKVGDKVLLYANAGKAILYDPVAHKIVNVAPINANQNSQPVSGNPEPIVAGESVDAEFPASPAVVPENE